jgi:hypothetical protein
VSSIGIAGKSNSMTLGMDLYFGIDLPVCSTWDRCNFYFFAMERGKIKIKIKIKLKMKRNRAKISQK